MFEYFEKYRTSQCSIVGDYSPVPSEFGENLLRRLSHWQCDLKGLNNFNFRYQLMRFPNYFKKLRLVVKAEGAMVKDLQKSSTEEILRIYTIVVGRVEDVQDQQFATYVLQFTCV